MSENVIVSFASQGREDYRKSLLRLIDSCLEHWSGDMLIYSPDHWLDEYRGVKIHKGWPDPKGIQSFTHEEMPYQFKMAMIGLALEKGYKRIIWLDSAMQMTKDILPLLLNSKTGIVTFHNLGHPLWKYISDDAIRILENDRFLLRKNDIYSIDQIWGGAFMIDFSRHFENKIRLFRCLMQYSCNGSFKDGNSSREGFVAHRHDQAIMSVLLYKKCDMLPYGTIVCPPHDTNGEYGNDFYLVSRGA